MNRQWRGVARLVWIAAIATLVVAAVPLAQADNVTTQLFVGTLASSSDVFTTTLTLASPGNVLLQTYGSGGGVNGQGTSIAAGGTDPFLAIFAGTGDGAAILTDAFANPFGTSLDLSNSGSFTGCPPAGAASIGGSAVCGDIQMNLGTLAAGSYTIVLSGGQYIANAVFDNGTLGEGFSDLTGGVFCNLAINGADCPNTSGNYALDVTTTTTSVVTPEPATILLVGSAMLVGCWKSRKRSTRRSE